MSRDRRLSRRSSPAVLTGGVAAAWTPASIASCVHWYRADLGATTSGGNLVSLEDRVGSADGADPGAAARPVYTAADAGMNNQSTFRFDGSADYMQFGANSDFNFLHDGTGGTFWIAFRTFTAHVNGLLVDNNNSTAANVGLMIYNTNTGTQIIQVQRGDGGGTRAINYTTAGMSTSTNYQLLIAHGTAATPDYIIRRNGVELTNGAYANAPAVGNATHALTLGRISGGASDYGNCVIAEFAAFNAVLSAGDITLLEEYGSDRYTI